MRKAVIAAIMKVSFTLLMISSLTAASPVKRAAPTVTITSPQATIVGLSGDVEKFPGIPFAQPPVGPLRLKPPQPITQPMGTVMATQNGNACPQLVFSETINDAIPTSLLGVLLDTPLFQKALSEGEDCLVLNIHRPSGTTPNSKLPVLFWIFGGGFELGWNSMYDGAPWVTSSVSMGQPIIVVTVNYRVGGFGFLPGKEVKADGSANLGLADQRLGLQWVADNIAAFGGDPTKVTIWGESAGAISVFDHMVLYGGNNTYKGQPLFRGAMMNSGSVIPVDPVDGVKGQAVYDTVVEAGGCSGSSDTLNCLRELPYEKFLSAANTPQGILSYSSVALNYLPRPDGNVLPASPDQLAIQGSIAKVPFILGDQEDEGTLFALFQSNITTESEVVNYLKSKYFFHASQAQIETLVNFYDDISTYGSPFRTGLFNNWYPQFKRLAAILGDLTFTLTRRATLTITNQLFPDLPTWSYLSSYDYGTPIMGTFHGSDILQVFFGILPNYASGAFHTYYINFVNTLNPNQGASSGGTVSQYPNWPQWKDGNQLLNMYPGSSQFITDNFRQDAFNFLLANQSIFYF